MIRKPIPVRSDWKAKLEAYGFDFHTIDGAPYWDESACYEFTPAQIDLLEESTASLNAMCLQAVQTIIERDWFHKVGVHDVETMLLIRRSWDRHDMPLYGRFDLQYDGTGVPKLLEFNADTPTSLLEASVAQWEWLEDVRHGWKSGAYDQFNSIHEKLIEQWKRIKAHQLRAEDGKLWFACVEDNAEDITTTSYLRDTAQQAGFDTEEIAINDIGWDETRSAFVDGVRTPIHSLFKLYPWEWLLKEEFGKHLMTDPWDVIEPPWKMLLSNKGILKVLWELFPDSQLLLPTYDSPELHILKNSMYVKKPMFSREGANIEVHGADRLLQATDGPYGQGDFVYQQYTKLPEFDGNFPVIGSWIIGNEPAGIGVREDRNEITRNTSRFVPHYFK